MSEAILAASSPSLTMPWYPGTVCTPACKAIFLEVILSPMASMLYSVGPIKTAPASSSTALLKSLFSDKNP